MHLNEFKDKFKEYPIGIVAGAGPSLHDLTDRQIESISRYPVIAVNSAILKFKNYDMKHLFYLSDDIATNNFSYYKQDLPTMKNCISLLYHDKLKDDWHHLKKENICWYRHKCWYDAAKKKYYPEGLIFTEDGPIIGCRTSVGSAIHWAYIMGLGRNPNSAIVLLGCDCAYRKDPPTGKINRYYWQFEGEQKPFRLDKEKIFSHPNRGMKKNQSGEEFYYDRHCEEFLSFWDALAKQAASQNISIINCSEGLLDSFPKMKLDEVLSKYAGKE